MKNKTLKALDRLGQIKRLHMLEKQKTLAEMQAKLKQLHQKIKDIAATKALEIESCRHDYTSRITLQKYLDGLEIQEKHLKKQLFHLVDFMIPVQESVREAFREVKSLEIAAENLQTEIRQESDKKEQQQLDELSLISKNGNQE